MKESHLENLLQWLPDVPKTYAETQRQIAEAKVTKDSVASHCRGRSKMKVVVVKSVVAAVVGYLQW